MQSLINDTCQSMSEHDIDHMLEKRLIYAKQADVSDSKYDLYYSQAVFNSDNDYLKYYTDDLMSSICPESLLIDALYSIDPTYIIKLAVQYDAKNIKHQLLTMLEYDNRIENGVSDPEWAFIQQCIKRIKDMSNEECKPVLLNYAENLNTDKILTLDNWRDFHKLLCVEAVDGRSLRTGEI